MMHLFRFDFNHIPGVKFHSNRSLDDLLDRPAMIVCNHQSMIDPAIFMSLSPRLILVANEHPGSYWVVNNIYRWMGHITLKGDDLDVEAFRRYIQEGYSFVVFPEGERNPDSSILRFHKGAFYLAEQLGLDIIPVLLHGANVVLPRNSFVVYPGTLTVEIGERVKLSDAAFGEPRFRHGSLRNERKQQTRNHSASVWQREIYVYAGYFPEKGKPPGRIGRVGHDPMQHDG